MADGEFAVAKTAINEYLLRADSTSASYQEIKDSQSVVEFGKKNLSCPGKRAGIKERCFYNLDPKVVLDKKEEDKKKPEDGKTSDGISSKFEYICQVQKAIISMYLQLTLIIGKWSSSHASVAAASNRSGIVRKI